MLLDSFSITAKEGGRKHFGWAKVGVGRRGGKHRLPAPRRNAGVEAKRGR